MANDQKSKINKPKQTENRGVTITSENFDISCRKDDREHNPDLSVRNVREDVKNVIDMMGPNTPHQIQSISSDADNEDSIYSTSVYSSVVKFKKVTIEDPSIQESLMTVCNISELTDCEYVPHTTEAGVQTAAQPYVYPEYAQQEMFYPYQHPMNYQNHYFPNVTGVNQQFKPIKSSKSEKRSRLSRWLGLNYKTKTKHDKGQFDLYKMNIEEPSDDHSPPRRLVFDLMDGIPKTEMNTVGTNTKMHAEKKFTATAAPIFTNNNFETRQYPKSIHDHVIRTDLRAGEEKYPDLTSYEKKYPNLTGQKNPNPVNDQFYLKNFEYKTVPQPVKEYVEQKKTKQKERRKREHNLTERIDIYYFDHGNAEYYRTTDAPPVIMTELLAERTEYYTKRFWAQFFGTITIGVSFVMSFLLQLVRFVLQSIVRPLTVGLVQLLSDYFIKPSLAVLFNGIVQPPLIFLYNVATSLRDLCEPIANSVGFFIREIAVLFKAIRLVQVDKCCKVDKSKESSCK